MMNKVYILVPIFFISCSWYGSHGRIYQSQGVSGKVILIIHDQISDGFGDYHNLLVGEILNNLDEKSLLNIEYLDRQFNLLTFKRSPYFEEYKHIASGYLFVSAKSPNFSDVDLRMELYDSNLDLVMTAHHNTFWGNSYFFPPLITRAIQDAASGAIKVFDRKLANLTR